MSGGHVPGRQCDVGPEAGDAVHVRTSNHMIIMSHCLTLSAAMACCSLPYSPWQHRSNPSSHMCTVQRYYNKQRKEMRKGGMRVGSAHLAVCWLPTYQGKYPATSLGQTLLTWVKGYCRRMPGRSFWGSPGAGWLAMRLSNSEGGPRPKRSITMPEVAPSIW